MFFAGAGASTLSLGGLLAAGVHGSGSADTAAGISAWSCQPVSVGSAAGSAAAATGPGGPRSVTVGQWLERWLAARTSPATSTVRGYAAHVRLYLKPHLGPILVQELTVGHVQAMFTAITREHEADGRQITRPRLLKTA